MKVLKLNLNVFLIICLTFVVIGCSGNTKQDQNQEGTDMPVSGDTLKEGSTAPPELTLINQNDSFANFLRALPRKDRSVVVNDFQGNEAGMEDYKYCVIDFPLLSEIEQCADVCMHLRTEFLFRQGKYEKIHFHDINGNDHPYHGGSSRTALNRFLCRIYSMSNTYSMSREMSTVPSFKDMKPGDVFINPADGDMLGHAIIIMDVAHDAGGNIYYQVAQGFTPACDFHLIRNSDDEQISPWFRLDPNSETINIAGFEFDRTQLKRWEE